MTKGGECVVRSLARSIATRKQPEAVIVTGDETTVDIVFGGDVAEAGWVDQVGVVTPSRPDPTRLPNASYVYVHVSADEASVSRRFSMS